MTDSLTKKQRLLKKELDEIAERIGVDYWNILDRERAARTTVLEVIRRELIRGEVVSRYTLIDEMLGMKLVNYFFPKKSSIKLWKTKRFERFNYYILERLYLVHKLALVKDVYRVPKGIAATIEEINALRNSVAHAFFPENLRAYRSKKGVPRKDPPVLYKGQDVFTATGVEKFCDDAEDIWTFIVTKMKRKKASKGKAPLTTLPPVPS